MSSVASSTDLLGACRVLFGPEACLDRQFLDSLDVGTVRRSFRRRAIEVHPDRAAVLRRHPAALAEAFKRVEAAYRTLCEHLAVGRGTASCPQAACPTARPAAWDRPASGPSSSPTNRASNLDGSTGAKTDHFWSGPIPARTLRLGEFLYYSGRISWSELIRALAWQARQTPRFGQLAGQFGYLTPDLVAAALKGRQVKEKVGEAALRLGFITWLQQQQVLQSQRRGHRRIGEYFVESGLVGAEELERLGRGLRAHNAKLG